MKDDLKGIECALVQFDSDEGYPWLVVALCHTDASGRVRHLEMKAEHFNIEWLV